MNMKFMLLLVHGTEFARSGAVSFFKTADKDLIVGDAASFHQFGDAVIGRQQFSVEV